MLQTKARFQGILGVADFDQVTQQSDCRSLEFAMILSREGETNGGHEQACEAVEKRA